MVCYLEGLWSESTESGEGGEVPRSPRRRGHCGVGARRAGEVFTEDLSLTCFSIPQRVSFLQESRVASLAVIIKSQFHKGVCLRFWSYQASRSSLINPAPSWQPGCLNPECGGFEGTVFPEHKNTGNTIKSLCLGPAHFIGGLFAGPAP